MKRRAGRWAIPGIAMGCLALAGIYASGSLVTTTALPVASVQQPPEARVMSLSPATRRGTITAFGQASARFEVTLAAQVAGRVLSVDRTADSGFEVGDGNLLAKIEDIPYRMAVADAERALADARLNLFQERRLAERAKAEWETAAFEDEPSDLALRVPQLAAADAAIAGASAALENAENNLRLTEIAVPFPAVIIERLIAPGDVVQIGTPLFRVASVDRVEVRVPLSVRQWAAVSPELGAPVNVLGPDSRQRWQGYVLRLEQHMGSNDRQRALVVAVDKPLAGPQPLFSGTFVSVEVPTRAIAESYRLPATALSADGRLWQADESGLLTAFTPATTIPLDDEILAVAPAPLGTVSFLVRPLANLTVGSRVRPLEVEPSRYQEASAR